MKAKTFLEWIGESRDMSNEPERVGISRGMHSTWSWYFKPEDLDDILDQPVYHLFIHKPRSTEQAFSIFKKILKRTGLKCKPVLRDFSNTGDHDSIWFTIDGEVNDDLFIEIKYNILHVSSQSRTMSQLDEKEISMMIYHMIKQVDGLTPENLVMMSKFPEMEKWARQHPNWPEDLTDWALSDW